MLTNLLLSLGWSRDDKHWAVLQAVSFATLIAGGTVDLSYWFPYYGIPAPSPVVEHWIMGVAAFVSWLSGKYNTSPLPGKQI